jgi:hypothetical protein
MATTGAEHVGSHEYVQLVANRTKGAVSGGDNYENVSFSTAGHEIEIGDSERCHGHVVDRSLPDNWRECADCGAE